MVLTLTPNGLSPHGRGKRCQNPFCTICLWSIPARAGETCRQSEQRKPFQVYPRTGGGNRWTGGLRRSDRGLSPHGRGKPTEAAPDTPPPGSIPARAGETAPRPGPAQPPPVYPRTGGGNPSSDRQTTSFSGLSPHGRGKRERFRGRKALPRSIPARAGETSGSVPAGRC